MLCVWCCLWPAPDCCAQPQHNTGSRLRKPSQPNLANHARRQALKKSKQERERLRAAEADERRAKLLAGRPSEAAETRTLLSAMRSDYRRAEVEREASGKLSAFRAEREAEQRCAHGRLPTIRLRPDCSAFSPGWAFADTPLGPAPKDPTHADDLSSNDRLQPLLLAQPELRAQVIEARAALARRRGRRATRSALNGLAQLSGDPDSLRRFRQCLAHFPPVFSCFLRVFTVSARRFQRAPRRNPGLRDSAKGGQTPFCRPS